MKRYKLTPTAQRDLDAIAEYIAVESTVERAMKVLREFREAFRNLGDMPGMGHFREDLLDRRYKFWSVYSYVIVYRWEVEPIQIVAVVHGARDLDAFLARRLG
ncbi:MAG: Plasmid stabilization system protein [Phycisphaerales bacterium]|nr:Plasmid stabilization system protein [Phycisphaerales bacterium]